MEDRASMHSIDFEDVTEATEDAANSPMDEDAAACKQYGGLPKAVF